LHRFSAQAVTFTFAPDVPAAYRIGPGETFVVATRDALDGKVRPGMSEKPVIDRANPATGPIAVEGLQPGQTLAVDILAIDVAAAGYLTFGGKPRFFEQNGGIVEFAPGARVPLAPMIGTIGVMPAAGSYSTMIPGDFGGNMDTRDIAAGATLYLQAQLPGGLLALGDVHSVQGDGETSGQGIETEAEVILRARVIPQGLSPHPYLIRNGQLMVILSADTLDEAAKQAVEAMASVITENSSLTYAEARMLTSIAGDLRVGQIVNSRRTVRVAIPLDQIPWRAPLLL
jgi:amidase